MKVVFSGGGTLGPVTPLLAIKQIIQEEFPETSFVWLGTKNGPEKILVEKENILFSVLNTGKFRRYISFWNIIDIFKIIGAFFHSLYFIWREEPDVCISAGGFTSVPLHWAAWIFGVPTWVHQQDVKVGMAIK